MNRIKNTGGISGCPNFTQNLITMRGFTEYVTCMVYLTTQVLHAVCFILTVADVFALSDNVTITEII